MKITNNQLKQIIKEELSRVLHEQEDPAKNELLMDQVFTYYDAEYEAEKDEEGEEETEAGDTAEETPEETPEEGGEEAAGPAGD